MSPIFFLRGQMKRAVSYQVKKSLPMVNSNMIKITKTTLVLRDVVKKIGYYNKMVYMDNNNDQS